MSDSVIGQAASQMLENKGVSATIGAGTAVMGVSLSSMQTWGALIATWAGVALTLLLLVRHFLGLIRDIRKDANEQIKEDDEP